MSFKGMFKDIFASHANTNQVLETHSNERLDVNRRSKPIYHFGLAEAVSVIVIIITLVTLAITVNIFIGFLASIVMLFLSTIRNVPEYHDVLLYWFGNPLGKGHKSGLYLYMWFLGVRRQLFDLHHLPHDIDQEDCFCKPIGVKRMKITYRRVVIRFGVCPIEARGFWSNMFAFFRRRKEAESLVNYAQMDDMNSAFDVLRGVALSSIATVIRRYTWIQLLGGQDESGKEEIAIELSDLQNQILQVMNDQAKQFGMKVHTIAIGDLDVSEDMAQNLEEIQKSETLGRAIKAFFEGAGIQNPNIDVPAVLRAFAVTAFNKDTSHIDQILRGFAGQKIFDVMGTAGSTAETVSQH